MAASFEASELRIISPEVLASVTGHVVVLSGGVQGGIAEDRRQG